MAAGEPNQRLAAKLSELGVSHKGLARRMREASLRDGGPVARTSHTAIAKYVTGETAQPGARALELLVRALSDVAGRRVSPDEVGYPTPEASGPAANESVFESPADVALRLQMLAKVGADDSSVSITEDALAATISRYGH